MIVCTVHDHILGKPFYVVLFFLHIGVIHSYMDTDRKNSYNKNYFEVHYFLFFCTKVGLKMTLYLLKLPKLTKKIIKVQYSSILKQIFGEIVRLRLISL